MFPLPDREVPSLEKLTRRLGFVPLIAASLALDACERGVLPLESLTRAAECAPVGGTWMLASPAGWFGPRVLVLDVSGDTVVSVTERPSRSAGGQWATTLYPATLVAAAWCSTVRITGALSATGASVEITLVIAGDTAKGTLTEWSSSSPIFGMRVDPAQLVPPDSQGPLSAADSTPILMIRVDDAWADDSEFLPRLLVRGLRAELAVPTSLLGLPLRNSWANLLAEAGQGFGIAAHSRTHSPYTTPGFAFMAEVLGSLQDLRQRGLPTDVFVQPGSWSDSLDFDTPAKLSNWRGALLRNVCRTFEGYVGGGSVPTGSDAAIPFGMAHTTISGYDSTSILYQYRRLFVRGGFTIFLVHSKDVKPPNALDWLLDSLAAAVASGKLRTVTLSSALP